MAWRKSSFSSGSMAGSNCAEIDTWRKSSASINDAGAGSECVEVGQGGVVVGVRDSKLGDASPVLEFGGVSWGRFLTGVRANRGQLWDHTDQTTGRPWRDAMTEMQPGMQPEPQPAPVPAEETASAPPTAPKADEPGTLAPADPTPPGLSPAGDASPEDGAPTGDALSAVDVHPSVLVRLADVLAVVENWFARHPEVDRGSAADLKSSAGTIERLP